MYRYNLEIKDFRRHTFNSNNRKLSGILLFHFLYTYKYALF